MADSTVEVLSQLERLGAKITLENGNLRVRYRCPPPTLPKVKSAIGFLKRHKAEAIACLAGGATPTTWDGLKWQSDSLDAQLRFRHMAARLYPFVGRRVRTPKGTGQLVQVFGDRATVVLENAGESDGKRKPSFFDPTDVFPVEIM